MSKKIFVLLFCLLVLLFGHINIHAQTIDHNEDTEIIEEYVIYPFSVNSQESILIPEYGRVYFRIVGSGYYYPDSGESDFSIVVNKIGHVITNPNYNSTNYEFYSSAIKTNEYITVTSTGTYVLTVTVEVTLMCENLPTKIKTGSFTYNL